MPALNPKSFFLWDKPRILVDIRPIGAFRKGSMESARSNPIEEYHNIDEFLNQEFINNSKEPLHLIDLDGKMAKQLSILKPLDYLEGGYKYFKSWREKAFETGPQINVLGGYTGSGKTELLHFMNKNGYQVINLEAIANHRGSVFGKIRNEIQPLHEDFQNQLLKLWLNLDENKPVWIEEKGPFLGKTGIPKSLQKRMENSTIYHLQVSFEERLQYLLRIYRDFDPSDFKSALRKLELRMGTSNNHKVLQFYNSGNIEKCFELLLDYYDKGYDKRRTRDWKGTKNYLYHRQDDLCGTLKQIENL